jgi:indole-3-glycerol phosphate synthase
MNILQTILAEKREEVLRRKSDVPLATLCGKPLYSRTPYSLAGSLKAHSPAVIAEVKKASPSKGVLRPDFDPVAIAREYASGGACALSVLTDEKFFQGRLEYLESIRRVVDLPLLRKDFILDPYQLHESKSAGADAVLLIVAALELNQLIELHAEARSLGLECLVEVHSEKEIEDIDGLSGLIVGINNRDLNTFETDLGVSMRIRPKLPAGVTCVSESGISSGDDLMVLARAGINAVLIGEMFMRAPSPGRALAEFLSRNKAVTS